MQVDWTNNERYLKGLECEETFYEYLRNIGDALIATECRYIDDNWFDDRKALEKESLTHLLIIQRISSSGKIQTLKCKFDPNGPGGAWASIWFKGATNQCLNPLYLDEDGIPHISDNSTASVLHKSHVEKGEIYRTDKILYFALPVESFLSIVCKRKL